MIARIERIKGIEHIPIKTNAPDDIFIRYSDIISDEVLKGNWSGHLMRKYFWIIPLDYRIENNIDQPPIK